MKSLFHSNTIKLQKKMYFFDIFISSSVHFVEKCFYFINYFYVTDRIFMKILHFVETCFYFVNYFCITERIFIKLSISKFLENLFPLITHSIRFCSETRSVFSRQSDGEFF